MTRRYGWGPITRRVHYAVPHGHGKTTTFLSALRLDGMFAPLVSDGALNGERFLGYVRQQLAPCLRAGDILVLDNLPTHKIKGVVSAVEACGAQVLFLPPYRPDLNPIEQVFSKIKNELRRREIRTIGKLEEAFGESLDWFSAANIANYYRHAGYTGATTMKYGN